MSEYLRQSHENAFRQNSSHQNKTNDENYVPASVAQRKALEIELFGSVQMTAEEEVYLTELDRNPEARHQAQLRQLKANMGEFAQLFVDDEEDKEQNPQETDEMAAQATQGKVVTESGSETSGQYSEVQGELSAETEEAPLYFVTKDDANIRSNDEKHAFKSDLIAKGTKVYVINTSVDGKNRAISQVQYVADANTKYWTTSSNISEVKNVDDEKYYTAFYNDIEVLEFPGAKESKSKLVTGAEYKLLNSCLADKTFYKVVKKDAEEAVGWIADYKNVLYGKETMTRQNKLKEFETWLETKLAEAKKLDGDKQIEFVQRVLSLVETESVKIAAEEPKYSTKDQLDTAFTATKSVNTDRGATVPHELIEVVRKFINITEFKVEEETTESTETETTSETSAAEGDVKQGDKNYTPKSPTNAFDSAIIANTLASKSTQEKTITPVVGGSRHSGIDWNSRLGVPQYRTQSDNLSIPEATCNVTTMAMTLERLGNSREDVIAAIDGKLKDGKEKTEDELKTLWEEKSEAYMKKITSEASFNYQKLRQNRGGLVGKEDEVSNKFKEIAQMEDLIDFYMYLKTDKPKDRELIFSDAYNDSLPEEINASKESKYNTDRKDLYYQNKKGKKIYTSFKIEYRKKIKDVLDQGGSVVISLNHKGNKGSHILSVQSINSEGLKCDDPFGAHAKDYRYGKSGDMFAGKDKNSRDRGLNGEPYRNTKYFNAIGKDYTKRDFTANAAQNLEEKEKKGDSITLNWEMINESSNGLINYIVFYEKN